MNLFKNMFKSSSEEQQSSKIEWKHLSDLNQLDEIENLSHQNAVLIFKHSTRCSISRYSLKQFENEFNLHEKITIYFLDLLNYREISNEIQLRFGVVHQSPQIILIVSGLVVYEASHSAIDAKILENFIN